MRDEKKKEGEVEKARRITTLSSKYVPPLSFPFFSPSSPYRHYFGVVELDTMLGLRMVSQSETFCFFSSFSSSFNPPPFFLFSPFSSKRERDKKK